MANGKEYVVVNEIKDTKTFIDYVFTPISKVTVSVHDLKDGGNVIIFSNQVASIEFNCKM